ncbi:MAG TPA: thioredoxin TrxC [Burkholderiales bacterium]|nr:thioredoxin TrxC [Burkholderiales bacterium]
MAAPAHVVCPHCNTTNRVPRERLRDNPTCGRCKRPLFDGRAVELDGPALERHVAASDIPLVVDFWAPWCGPCKMMAPHFERAASELEPEVRLAKVNTEEEQRAAARYNIRSIPTLIAFKGGREVARQSGAMDAAGLARWVRSTTG